MVIWNKKIKLRNRTPKISTVMVGRQLGPYLGTGDYQVPCGRLAQEERSDAKLHILF